MDKPQVPSDLWEQIADAEQSRVGEGQPPNSFTAKDYATLLNSTSRLARDRLFRLVEAGKIKIVGHQGRVNYYRMVDK